MTISQTLRAKLKNGGFTLIELGVVLLLIGVVLAIVIPRYGTYLTRGTMRSELRRMASMVRYLGNEASRTGDVYYLNFDVSKGRYWVAVDTGAARPIKQSTHLTRVRELPESIRFKDVMVYGRGKKSQGTNRMAFYPRAENDEAIICLTDRNKKRFYSLHIKPYAARSDMYNYQYKGYKEKRHKSSF